MHSESSDTPEDRRADNWELGAALEVLRSTAQEVSWLRVHGSSDELFSLVQARHRAAQRLLERIHRALGMDVEGGREGRVG